MPRIPVQADLFAAPSAPTTDVDPLAELAAMLQELRAAAAHPWTPLSEAMQREYRA
ncbi:MAG TPA: hypothetical protein VGS12_03690 [Caulobacteraceae bacterium]|nr:hypothetical protein [Caulobacteraceae bacterium]